MNNPLLVQAIFALLFARKNEEQASIALEPGPRNYRQERSTLDRSLTPLILTNTARRVAYRASVLQDASFGNRERSVEALPAPPLRPSRHPFDQLSQRATAVEPCGATRRDTRHSPSTSSHAPQGRRRGRKGSHDP